MSPLVPATVVVLLALLWVLSAFAGWATAAFCTDRGLGPSCQAHVAAAVRPSSVVAGIAALLAAAALAVAPLTRPGAARRITAMRLLGASAVCWAAALVVLFVLGEAGSGF